jgi:hypothetical protein
MVKKFQKIDSQTNKSFYLFCDFFKAVFYEIVQNTQIPKYKILL